MRRRIAVTLAALVVISGLGLVPATAAVTVCTPIATGWARTPTGEDIAYEVWGQPDGPNLFLLTPVYATTRLWTDAYLQHFCDKYRVLIVDYPHQGRSDGLKDPTAFTADRVARDYLALADAAGMKRFAIAGYSWGGNSALYLATRTSRVTALAVGGWPALGGPWAELLQLAKDLGQGQYVAYYTSLQKWARYERELRDIARLKVPRLNYVDTGDNGDPDMIGIFRTHRATLKRLGWETHEVNSGLENTGGSGHTGGLLPPIAGPLLRAFLDRHLPGSPSR